MKIEIDGSMVWNVNVKTKNIIMSRRLQFNILSTEKF